MQRLVIVVFVTILVVSLPLMGQSPEVLWESMYGDSGYGCFYSIQQTDDGGFIMAGTFNGYLYLVKTDANGDTTGETNWILRDCGDGYAVGYDVIQNNYGCYNVVGSTSQGLSNSDVYHIEVNYWGEVFRSHTYGGPNDDAGYSIQETMGGGYVIAGYTDPLEADEDDFYLIKTNNVGDLLWSRTYGGAYIDIAEAVVQAADSGYVIAGFTNSYGDGGDIYLVKTDASGDTLWTRVHGGTLWDTARDIQRTDDGGYIIAGYFDGASLIKTDANGNVLWTGDYGTGTPNAVWQTTDGGYILAGEKSFPPYYQYPDFCLVRTNSSGDVLWTDYYGGLFDDIAYDVVQTSDGGFIAAGYQNLDGWFNIVPYVIRLDVESSGVNTIVQYLPNEFILHPNYPNPFNPTTTLSYNLPFAGHVRLQIYDILGRHVSTIVDTRQSAGQHKIIFDASNLSSGVYFYQLKTSNFQDIKKMVILK